MLNQPQITPEVLKSMTGAVARVLSVSHPSDIADCVSEACVRVLSAIDTFDAAKGDFKGWASVIAGNVARNWRKASANRGHDSETSADEDGDTESLTDALVGEDGRATIERRAMLASLREAMEVLDDDSRTFLALISDGMGQTEAGATLGWSPATSTRRYRAIVATLAEEMA